MDSAARLDAAEILKSEWSHLRMLPPRLCSCCLVGIGVVYFGQEVAPGFEGLVAEFRWNLAEHGQVGIDAQQCVVRVARQKQHTEGG